MTKWKILKGPVFFLGPGSIELELNHRCAVFAGERGSPIRALRIDHENFISPRDRSQATCEICLLVFNRNKNADRDFHTDTDLSTRQGLPAQTE